MKTIINTERIIDAVYRITEPSQNAKESFNETEEDMRLIRQFLIYIVITVYSCL
jgi:hypothetical protein